MTLASLRRPTCARPPLEALSGAGAPSRAASASHTADASVAAAARVTTAASSAGRSSREGGDDQSTLPLSAMKAW